MTMTTIGPTTTSTKDDDDDGRVGGERSPGDVVAASMATMDTAGVHHTPDRTRGGASWATIARPPPTKNDGDGGERDSSSPDSVAQVPTSSTIATEGDAANAADDDAHARHSSSSSPSAAVLRSRFASPPNGSHDLAGEGHTHHHHRHPSFAAAADMAIAQAAMGHHGQQADYNRRDGIGGGGGNLNGNTVVDERSLTLADLAPSLDDEVEAALIDALERRERLERVVRGGGVAPPLGAVLPGGAAPAFRDGNCEGGGGGSPDTARGLRRRAAADPTASPPTSPPKRRGHEKTGSTFADLADQLREEHRGGGGGGGSALGGWGGALKRLELSRQGTSRGDYSARDGCLGSSSHGTGAKSAGGVGTAPGSRRTMMAAPPSPSPPPEGSVDAMCRDAGVIFPHRRTGSRVQRMDDDEDLEAARRTPSDDGDDRKKQARVKWGRLRHAVHATNAMNVDHGGDDEKQRQSPPPSTENYNDGEDEDDGGGPMSPSAEQKKVAAAARDKSYRRKMENGNVCTRTFWWLLYRFRMVFQLRKHLFHLLRYVKTVMFWLGVPLLGVAAVLFYLVPGGEPGPMTQHTGASWSWWLIFIFRQIVTLSLGRGAQYFFVDCLCLRSRAALRVLGSALTLGMVQSKGWPFTLTAWALWNFAILQGDFVYTNHWMFWQEPVRMFNGANPAGDVLANEFYKSLLIAAIVVGVLTSMKRAVVSFYLGSKTCEHYGPQLEKLMKEMIILSTVANLAKEIERSRQQRQSPRSPRSLYFAHGDGFAPTALYMWQSKIFSQHHHPHRRRATAAAFGGVGRSATTTEDDDAESEGSDVDDDGEANTGAGEGEGEGEGAGAGAGGSRGIDDVDVVGDDEGPPRDRAAPLLTQKLRMSERNKLLHLLDFWEEPRNLDDIQHSNVTIHDILQFRQALQHMSNMYPFSLSFGLANTRESCIASAQQVYQRLLEHTPQESVLPFETISIVALDGGGELDMERTKPLVRLFRPDRNGRLTMLDFVRSCDGVYKRLRMLRASVANSSAIDNAYEKIINGVFFFVVAIIVLLILRFDPWATLLALSSLTVSFAFAFGSAVSKFTEGVLLVTIRKPYDIGDRIHLSDPNQDTSADGSSTWFVENITLFTTTLRFATTNEVCSIANGSLANSRIVNGARSPKALVYVYLKFGIDVPYEKVKFFRSTVDSFVKSRPREWTALAAFRARGVHADLGYIEYVLVLQHREAWQNIGAILGSKAELSSFCLEVSKKLGMRYIAPPLPVQLGMEENFMSKLPTDLFEGPPPGNNDRPQDINSSASQPNSGLEAIQELFKAEGENKTKKVRRRK